MGMNRSETCGCCQGAKTVAPRHPTDTPIAATPGELEAIRLHLQTIEKLLGGLFGPLYTREPQSLKLRAQVAELIERHFEGIVTQWEEAISSIFGLPTLRRESGEFNQDLSNALIRFAAHLRDPNELSTYVYLRRHCQQGMLSRATPSQFNTIHIALKQVILQHVRATMRGRKEEVLRDVVVASIDERRLMVSWFYIESRESALRASEEKYRNSIDHAPDVIYEIEPGTWRVLSANAAADKVHRMLMANRSVHSPLQNADAMLAPDAHSIASHFGAPISDFVPPEMREETVAHLQRVMERGSDQTHDLPLGPFFFDVNSAIISYGSERFIQMILRDVTQRREMLDSLVKAERLAAAGTFAAGVAHEVNNPLASISSLVQSLLPGESDSARRTTLHTILSQITRISGTLKDLVNFARPSTAQRKPIDLNSLITETLRLITYNKRFDGLKIEPSLASDLKPVFADNNEIQQVLLNLLLNAADATQHPGGCLRVITENFQPADGDRSPRVLLRIVDNGIGIPKEHLERVFDPFFTTKPAGSGVGLGLSLCQRIILGNRGNIRIDSEVGRGTSVTISLPVYEGAAQAATASVEQ